MNSYDLHRAWFDFAFENQGVVSPNHTAMYAWFVELNNRMGWAKEFSSPASQTMAAIGVKHHATYKKTLDDLVKFGFVKVVKESKNQWTACVIALTKNSKAHSRALDKALSRHVTKQEESTPQGTCDINKPLNLKTLKPLNFKTYIGADAKKKSDDEDLDQVDASLKKEKKVAPKKEKGFDKSDFRKALIEDGADPQHVDDWLKVRTAKRAVFTQTSLTQFLNECYENNFPVAKAVQVCAERSWQGFKFQWLLNDKNNGQSKTTHQTRQDRLDGVQRGQDLALAILRNIGQDTN